MRCMLKTNLGMFTNGWIVGDFEPSIVRTKECEFLVRYYKAGDKEIGHVHKIATEITVCVNGVFVMAGQRVERGDVIYLDPGDHAEFECIEDGATAVLKMPSVPGDKYEIAS